MADRLLEHGAPANGSESATLAFNLAYLRWRPATNLRTGLTSANRKERQAFKSHPDYLRFFTDAKSQVRKMCVRAVEIPNAVEQAVFEIYAHVALDTPYNSFNNH